MYFFDEEDDGGSMVVPQTPNEEIRPASSSKRESTDSICYLFFSPHQLVSEPKFLIKMFSRRSEDEDSEYPFFEGDGSSSDEWREYDVIEEEEGFVGKGGFGGEEDNIEDIIVVANDICSSMIQTTLSVDVEEDVNTKSHKLMSFEKNIIMKGRSIWEKIRNPLTPNHIERGYFICCKNTIDMINSIKDRKEENRAMFTSINKAAKLMLVVATDMICVVENDICKEGSKDNFKDKYA
uniref:Uncharacterized protein n=1 Tax=Tanacetum cinerariifolium TaxID=118510 RepID=A0A6L2J2W9_TANCI|nr:hypothetical protein [Tanacetum cinerariifolium]